MKESTKNIVVTILFCIVFIGLFFVNIFAEDRDISVSERRRLTQFPELSFRSILDSSFMDSFEDYVVDQFIFRDGFRRIKTFMAFDVFRHLDNNDLFFIDDYIFSILYPLSESGVHQAAGSINNMIDRYFENNPNVFFSIIPDKNYFLDPSLGRLRLDYDRLTEIMIEEVSRGRYIDIFDQLTLSSFYRTDIHWRQEKLPGVVNTLSRNMNMGIFHNNHDFEKRTINGFRGSYFGQLGINIEPDDLVFLNNRIINSAIVRFNNDWIGPVYDPRGVNSIDMYDIFLSGAKALITIDNPYANNDRELILFRDSFGSSLAPLLIPAYSRITVIDLRYISSNFVSQLVDFNDNQDVLFLYSVNIINNGNLLR